MNAFFRCQFLPKRSAATHYVLVVALAFGGLVNTAIAEVCVPFLPDPAAYPIPVTSTGTATSTRTLTFPYAGYSETTTSSWSTTTQLGIPNPLNYVSLATHIPNNVGAFQACDGLFPSFSGHYQDSTVYGGPISIAVSAINGQLHILRQIEDEYTEANGTHVTRFLLDVLDYSIPTGSYAYNITRKSTYEYLKAFPGLIDQGVTEYNDTSGVVAGIASILPVSLCDAACKEEHRQRALDAELQGLTLSLFNALSGFSSGVTEAVVNLVASAAETSGTNWGAVIGTAVGIIAAAYFGGETALAIGTVTALMLAYYAATQAIETKIANDPPDSNYQQIYQYSNAQLPVDLGFGPAFNQYIGTGFDAMVRLTEARQGMLTSLERGQGALAAGDVTAVAAQWEAAEAFALDYQRFAPLAGVWIGSLPDYLHSNQFDVGVEDVSMAYSVFDETARTLGATTGTAPEPGTLALLGLGLAGLAATRRRKQ